MMLSMKKILLLTFISTMLTSFTPYSTSKAEEIDAIGFDITVDSPGKKGVEACFYFFDKFSGQWIIAGWYYFKNGKSKAYVDTKYPVVGYVGTAGDYGYSSNVLEHDVLYHSVSKEKITVPVGTEFHDEQARTLGFIIAPMKNGRGDIRFTQEFLHKQSP